MVNMHTCICKHCRTCWQCVQNMFCVGPACTLTVNLHDWLLLEMIYSPFAWHFYLAWPIRHGKSDLMAREKCISDCFDQLLPVIVAPSVDFFLWPTAKWKSLRPFNFVIPTILCRVITCLLLERSEIKLEDRRVVLSALLCWHHPSVCIS